MDVDNFINSTYLSEVFAAYGRDQLVTVLGVLSCTTLVKKRTSP